MHPGKFIELCLQTARALDMPEADHFAEGVVVTLDGVDMQFIQDAHQRNLARLFLELGDISSMDKLEVYENLFSIQLLMEGVVDGQFVLDNLHDRILFVARLPLSDQTQPDQLAIVIRSFVRQVSEWRSTILNGQWFGDDDEDGERVADHALVTRASSVMLEALA